MRVQCTLVTFQPPCIIMVWSTEQPIEDLHHSIVYRPPNSIARQLLGGQYQFFNQNAEKMCVDKFYGFRKWGMLFPTPFESFKIGTNCVQCATLDSYRRIKEHLAQFSSEKSLRPGIFGDIELSFQSSGQNYLPLYPEVVYNRLHSEGLSHPQPANNQQHLLIKKNQQWARSRLS